MVCITFSHTFWRFKMSKMKNFFYTLLISSSLPHNREEDENIITFPHACWNEIKHLCLTYNTSWEFEKALDHPMTMISVITARIIGRNFKPQPKFLNWNMLKNILKCDILHSIDKAIRSISRYDIKISNEIYFSNFWLHHLNVKSFIFYVIIF